MSDAQSLSTLIWSAAASPVQATCSSFIGTCWFCGASMARGVLVSRWAGSGFNSYARAQHRADDSATHVCEACVFVCSRLSPVPGRPPKPGKKLGGNFRNYSHGAAVMPSGKVSYFNASKAESPSIVAFILEPRGQPWGLAVSLTGQKHVIPHAPMNRSGSLCSVAFEDQVLRFARSDFRRIHGEMQALRVSSGCSSDAIISGIYHTRDLNRDLRGVEAFERVNAWMRGGGLFELASFLTWKPK